MPVKLKFLSVNKTEGSFIYRLLCCWVLMETESIRFKVPAVDLRPLCRGRTRTWRPRGRPSCRRSGARRRNSSRKSRRAFKDRNTDSWRRENRPRTKRQSWPHHKSCLLCIYIYMFLYANKVHVTEAQIDYLYWFSYQGKHRLVIKQHCKEYPLLQTLFTSH